MVKNYRETIERIAKISIGREKNLRKQKKGWNQRSPLAKSLNLNRHNMRVGDTDADLE
jgi:hypothetical protein